VSGPTFHVAGHHYALVVLQGLEPGSSTRYDVRIDGSVAWPLADSRFPPSRIRTIDPTRSITLISGSCREAPANRSQDPSRQDPDVLDAFAIRMADQPDDTWPDLLMLLGDQVYADETSPAMRDFIRTRRDIRRAPKSEVADFEEYTRLYLETWSDPTIRWLLSTLPSAMIFDDHDVRDDWNTSHAWRVDMQRTDWWDERISGALMSYWIYQHLGNLSPEALEGETIYDDVRAADDGAPALRRYAQEADREADGAKGTMWSYRRDLGTVRLLVIDSRCGRMLADGRRAMISDAEFDWIERQTEDGSFDHLVVGTSMPWLLPRALHDVESWNEALCAGSRGPILARLGESVRRAVDLEHWAAFRQSFDRLAAWFERLARAEDGRAPASICVLSGDVHHSYVCEADYEPVFATRIFQITCSPFNNTIPLLMRVVFHLGWSKTVERFVLLLSRWTRVPPLPIRWHHPSGPHFGNTLAELTFAGRTARVRLERSAPVGDSPDETMKVTDDLPLTELPRVKKAP
jgi:phosphodiesterase/alkaline phosphatase D-like protein